MKIWIVRNTLIRACVGNCLGVICRSVVILAEFHPNAHQLSRTKTIWQLEWLISLVQLYVAFLKTIRPANKTQNPSWLPAVKFQISMLLLFNFPVTVTKQKSVYFIESMQWHVKKNVAILDAVIQFLVPCMARYPGMVCLCIKIIIKSNVN